MIEKLLALFSGNAVAWLLTFAALGSGLLAGWWITRVYYRADIAALKQTYAEEQAAAATDALARLQAANRKGDELAAQVAAAETARKQLGKEKDREIQNLTTGRPCLGADVVRLLNSGHPGAGVREQLPEASGFTLDADSALAADTASGSRGQVTGMRSPLPCHLSPDACATSDTDIALWARNARDEHDACRERLEKLRNWFAD
jgi:hypothetical protein